MEIAAAERLYLLPHAAVLAVEVEGAVYRPIPRRLSDLGQLRKEGFLRHLPQHLFAEHAADRPQLLGDGAVLPGQILVSRAGVQNTQGVAAGVEIHVQPLHDRVGCIREVDGHHAAHGGGGLIHQAAGLSEEHVFRILADLRQLHRGTMPLPEQLIEHRPQQYLEGGGGAESAALGHGGGHIYVQPPAPQVAAHLLHPGRHAPDQCRRGVFLPLLRSQLTEIHLRHGIALGQHADNTAVGDG